MTNGFLLAIKDKAATNAIPHVLRESCRLRVLAVDVELSDGAWERLVQEYNAWTGTLATGGERLASVACVAISQAAWRKLGPWRIKLFMDSSSNAYWLSFVKCGIVLAGEPRKVAASVLHECIHGWFAVSGTALRLPLLLEEVLCYVASRRFLCGRWIVNALVNYPEFVGELRMLGITAATSVLSERWSERHIARQVFAGAAVLAFVEERADISGLLRLLAQIAQRRRWLRRSHVREAVAQVTAIPAECVDMEMRHWIYGSRHATCRVGRGQKC